MAEPVRVARTVRLPAWILVTWNCDVVKGGQEGREAEKAAEGNDVDEVEGPAVLLAET